MKKHSFKIAALALVAGMGISTQANAWFFDGPWNGGPWGGGPWDGPWNSGYYPYGGYPYGYGGYPYGGYPYGGYPYGGWGGYPGYAQPFVVPQAAPPASSDAGDAAE